MSTKGRDIFVQMTWAPPDVIPAPLPSDQVGKLLEARPFQTPTAVADISSVEFSTPNPDGFINPETGEPELDSNPYAVLAQEGRQLVADAAGNTIIEVRNGQAPRVFAVLPQHGDEGSRQATPTSLANGPDGTILVGELAHEEEGEGRVTVLSSRGRYLGFIGEGGSIIDVPGGLHHGHRRRLPQRPPVRVGALRRRHRRRRRVGCLGSPGSSDPEVSSINVPVPGRRRRRSGPERVRGRLEHRPVGRSLRGAEQLGSDLAGALLI